jgi:hypothetical protein
LQSGNIIHDKVENLWCAIKKSVSKLIKQLKREKRQSSEKPRGSLKGTVYVFSVLFNGNIKFQSKEITFPRYGVYERRQFSFLKVI